MLDFIYMIKTTFKFNFLHENAKILPYKFDVITRSPDKSAYQKIISLFLNQNICCWYSKELSR